MNPVAIHAFNPGPMTGAGNWTWLLPGREPTLIDAGTGDPRHIEALEQALAGSPLRRVIVTHAHTDHASGAPALAARFPAAEFVKMPWPERDARYPVPWRAIADGDRVEAGDSSLVAVHTPGHAPDHICLWHPASRTMFCADLAIKGGSIYIPSTLGGDLAAYARSLERVMALDPVRMFPAHGEVIDEPAVLLREYIAHRRQREQQVLDSLAAGAATADDVLTRMYPGVKPALAPFARDTVVAHLLKLEREGRVRRAAAADSGAEAWHIIGP